jgi:hypothetical protein
LSFLARFVSFPASPFLSFPPFRSTGVFERFALTLDVADARRPERFTLFVGGV